MNIKEKRNLDLIRKDGLLLLKRYKTLNILTKKLYKVSALEYMKDMHFIRYKEFIELEAGRLSLRDLDNLLYDYQDLFKKTIEDLTHELAKKHNEVWN